MMNLLKLMPVGGGNRHYLRGVVTKEVATTDIYKGVLPFIGLQILGMLLIWQMPFLATWLPEMVF